MQIGDPGSLEPWGEQGRVRFHARNFPNKFLTESSGLFKPRAAILMPVEAGRRAPWRASDAVQHICSSFHLGSGFHDFCALQAALRRPAQGHRPPSGGPQKRPQRATSQAFPRRIARKDGPPRKSIRGANEAPRKASPTKNRSRAVYALAARGPNERLPLGKVGKLAAKLAADAKSSGSGDEARSP
jgi:hypothetical protein